MIIVSFMGLVLDCEIMIKIMYLNKDVGDIVVF